jgi:ribose transport system substrate-binding protein
MFSKSRNVLAVMAALGLLLAGACSGTTSRGQARAPEKLKIAVIPKGTTHEFWKSVHYGAAKAATELGVEVIWLGPLQENDREQQITVLQNFITQGVDGICLAPLDSQALVPPVREAQREGIPVVIFDSGLDDKGSFVSYVATDNFHGGELGAECMAQLLQGKGNVILLRYTQGSESTTQREEGFLSKIKEYPGIRVISSDQYAGTSSESSLDKAQQLLNKFRGQVDGIFCVNESSAEGMLGALEEAGVASEIAFIGFDSSPRMVQALRDGKMKGIVLQDPVTMGYMAVKSMVDHLRGTAVPERISTGEAVGMQANMDEPKMHQLLHPAQYQD